MPQPGHGASRIGDAYGYPFGDEPDGRLAGPIPNLDDSPWPLAQNGRNEQDQASY
jgi:hypothetical protein